MNIFTDVYTKSREVLQSQKLDDSWSDISRDLKLLLEADGPHVAKGKSLDDLRQHLDDSMVAVLAKCHSKINSQGQ